MHRAAGGVDILLGEAVLAASSPIACWFLIFLTVNADLVDELKNSWMANTIVCPTGFFNDMSEFLKMAKGGTVYLIGDGQRKLNPIHGADLAKVCVDAGASGETEIPVGGPVA